MNTMQEVERELAEVTANHDFGKALIEFNRLTKIIGSVEDDEVLALAWIAIHRSKS